MLMPCVFWIGHVAKNCVEEWRAMFAALSGSGHQDEVPQDWPLFCCNCGARGHRFKQCKEATLGRHGFSSGCIEVCCVHPSDAALDIANDVKCFVCNEVGHIARNCPRAGVVMAQNRGGRGYGSRYRGGPSPRRIVGVAAEVFVLAVTPFLTQGRHPRAHQPTRPPPSWPLNRGGRRGGLSRSYGRMNGRHVRTYGNGRPFRGSVAEARGSLSWRERERLRRLAPHGVV